MRATMGREPTYYDYAKDQFIHYLWIFPVTCSLAWFFTLTPLLILWLVDGRPVYPGQSNPYVAFISDIGAFRLKPLFIILSAVTAVSYLATLHAVHFARYNSRMYNVVESWYRKAFSVLSVIGAFVASAGLVLLTFFDTYRYYDVHQWLLFSCFVGLAISSLCTVGLYLDRPWWKDPRDFFHSRPFCTACCFLVLLEVVLSAVFWGTQNTGYWAVSGIFEWLITYVGCFYILCLVGFTKMPPKYHSDEETAPLLSNSNIPNSGTVSSS